MAYIRSSYPYSKVCSVYHNNPPTKTILQSTKTIQDGILQAELKYQKLKMRKVPWSRLLQESMDPILICRVILSRKKGARVSTRYITRLEIRVIIHKSLHPSIVQVKNYLTNA